MQYIGSRNDPSIKSLLLIVVIVLVVAFYAMVSFGTGDWLWFNPRFSETPNAILIHCYGQDVNVQPGSTQFELLTRVVNESLSGTKRWDELTMSNATYEDYRTDANMKVLELRYPGPVRVHSNYKYFSNVDKLVIPLEGRHAQTNAVFGQSGDNPSAGSLHIESTTQIDSYISNLGLCPGPMSSN